jgi:hypothetical protein
LTWLLTVLVDGDGDGDVNGEKNHEPRIDHVAV